MYRFPADITPFIKIKSKQELLNLFQPELKRSGLASQNRKVIQVLQNDLYLRITCSFPECKWLMHYKQRKTAQGYILYKYICYHCHLYTPLLKNQQIFSDNRQTLKQPLMTEGDIFKYLQINYNMTTKQFIRYCSYADQKPYGSYGVLMMSNENRKRRDQSTLNALNNLYSNLQKSITFICQPKLQQTINIPEFVYISTKNAKKIYEAKGQIVAMTILYDKIHQQSQNGQRLLCAIFYGILANYQCVFYAASVFPEKYAIIKNDKILFGIHQSISLFFRLMGACETFITQSDKNIVKATRYSLKKNSLNIYHLIDPYDYVKKKFPQNQDLQEQAIIMLLSRNDEQYAQNKIKWFKDSNSSEFDRKIMQKCLKQYGSKPIYAKTSPFFIAGLLQQNVNLTLIEMINSKIYLQTLGKLLQQFIKMNFKIDKIYQKKQLSIIGYLRVGKPSIFTLAYPFKIQDRINEDPKWTQKFKNFRLNYYKQGFTYFLGQISKTGETDFIKAQQPQQIGGSPPRVAFQDIDKSEYMCIYSQQLKKYECSCDYTKFWGIPCKHLCKLCDILDFQIQDYIQKYWKLQVSYQDMRAEYWLSKGILPPKQGPPKKSNRNMTRF